MPRRPPSICAHPGCGAITTGRHCHKHTTQRHAESNGRRPESDKLYKTARWQALRASKLAANPLCEECQRAKKVTPATLVDHIRPVRDGGPMWDPANLQSLCDPCHVVKTRQDLGARAVGRGGRISTPPRQ